MDNNINFELKFGLLLTFNGLVGDGHYTHLKEFHIVCIGIKPNRVDKEQVTLKDFPLFLKGIAKA